MHTYIKLKASSFKLKSVRNELPEINNALASAHSMVTIFNQIKRKKLRKYIIEQYNSKFPNSMRRLSQKQIIALEHPNTLVIPVNIVDILEIIVEDIKSNKSRFHYRADNNNEDIVSMYMVKYTLYALQYFKAWLKAHKDNPRSGCEKYRKESNYISNRLEEFNSRYPGVFNSLFEE